jgi:hypothetical protein
MNKNLVICCSRSRPSQLNRMLESFYETSVVSDIIILLDEDDPYIDDYKLIIESTPHVISKRETTTSRINKSINYAYEYHCVTNDDFVYKTQGWDIKLIESIEKSTGIGIAYGNDLLARVTLPTTSIVSTEIIKVLGWLQLPTLKHLFGDNVWKFMGDKLKIIHYRNDIIIEHLHYFSGKCQEDETYKETNSRSMYNDDQHAFETWIINQSKTDISKIERILNLWKKLT